MGRLQALCQCVMGRAGQAEPVQVRHVGLNPDTGRPLGPMESVQGPGGGTLACPQLAARTAVGDAGEAQIFRSSIHIDCGCGTPGP